MNHNRVFPLHLNSTIVKFFHRLVKNESWKWYLCLGHLNFSGLKLLSTSSVVHGLPSIEKPKYVCEVCTLSVRDRGNLGCSQKRDLGACKGTSLLG